jgi:hypothetical protein
MLTVYFFPFPVTHSLFLHLMIYLKTKKMGKIEEDSILPIPKKTTMKN